MLFTYTLQCISSSRHLHAIRHALIYTVHGMCMCVCLSVCIETIIYSVLHCLWFNLVYTLFSTGKTAYRLLPFQSLHYDYYILLSDNSHHTCCIHLRLWVCARASNVHLGFFFFCFYFSFTLHFHLMHTQLLLVIIIIIITHLDGLRLFAAHPYSYTYTKLDHLFNGKTEVRNL